MVGLFQRAVRDASALNETPSDVTRYARASCDCCRVRLPRGGAMLRPDMRALPLLLVLLASPVAASDEPVSEEHVSDESVSDETGEAPVPPDATLEAPAKRSSGFELSAGLAGRFGGSVGHVLFVPAAYAFPGVALELGYDAGFWDTWYFAGTASLSLGVDDTGGPLGSYRGQLAVGATWLDLDWLALSTEVHAGVASVAFVPIPRWGLGHSLVVTPVDLGWLAWELGLDVNTDLLVIAPALGATVGTGLRFSADRWFLIAEVEAGGEVMIALFANTLGAAVAARVTSGWTF